MMQDMTIEGIIKQLKEHLDSGASEANATLKFSGGYILSIKMEIVEEEEQ